MKRIRAFLQNNPSTVQIIFFVSVVLVLFMVIVSNSLKIVQQRYQIIDLEDTILELENENNLLVEKLEKTSTETYIEEIAREKLGMVRNGETPVQVNETVVEEIESGTKEKIDSKDKTEMYLKSWYEELGEWFNGVAKKG